MRPQNLLFILSDEHTRDISACYGHPIVKTPNIDRLAARGTRFTAAYTNCPICVPARASLQTGRFVADNRCWDNAHPYHGQLPSWGHRLREQGHLAVSIGKLHFRSADDFNGFAEEQMPLHVVEGRGDLLGSIRRPKLLDRKNIKSLARELGPGESGYAGYDRRIRNAACEWLRTRAKQQTKPWILFVSFVKPHFPLIAPPDFFRLYDPAKLPMPRLYSEPDRSTHPVIKALRSCMNYDDFFESSDRVKLALANYLGMVSFLDDNIGQVVTALEEAGLADNTRVLYTTDHGDNQGVRGLWGKSVHYEEAAAIPMILAGADVPANRVARTPVSLVDCYQTILESVGAKPHSEDASLPGRSLFEFTGHDDLERVVLGEYHAAASITACYMLRKGRWKYMHYVGYRPQLFDLEDDPGETRDLGESAVHAEVRRMLEMELRKLIDPEAVCEAAFRDQEATIARNGGIDAVKARGDFGHSPVPGEKPEFA
ncbi:MAG: sulfatase-like hydrolase/transferase [Proteobacteria bacterium]|nr:sulfatase-like hydrolase/transferase [Pseudomonadota bacterium]